MRRGASILKIKRAAIWRQPQRNRLIARLARQLQTGDGAALTRSFPAIPQSVLACGALRVAVLVENVEHLICLLRRLPGSTPATGGEVNMAGRSQRDCQLLAFTRSTMDPKNSECQYSTKVVALLKNYSRLLLHFIK